MFCFADNAVAQQIERYDDATKKYEARIKKLEVKIHVNRGRQEDLRRQLQELEGEERRLLNNKEFERKVQDRAGEVSGNNRNFWQLFFC